MIVVEFFIAFFGGLFILFSCIGEKARKAAAKAEIDREVSEATRWEDKHIDNMRYNALRNECMDSSNWPRIRSRLAAYLEMYPEFCAKVYYNRGDERGERGWKQIATGKYDIMIRDSKGKWLPNKWVCDMYAMTYGFYGYKFGSDIMSECMFGGGAKMHRGKDWRCKSEIFLSEESVHFLFENDVPTLPDDWDEKYNSAASSK